MIKQASDRREHLIRKSNEKRSTCTRGPDKDRHYDPDLPNNSKNIQSLFDDGVHPNAEGHELIFKTVLPEFNRLIDKS